MQLIINLDFIISRNSPVTQGALFLILRQNVFKSFQMFLNVFTLHATRITKKYSFLSENHILRKFAAFVKVFFVGESKNRDISEKKRNKKKL